jgi:hypothetical protein
MTSEPMFELWLEFEHWVPQPDDDPTDDFFNMQVILPDGRRYGLNVRTYKFLRRARYPWPYQEGVGAPEEYLLAPDLFVERLDRELLERVVRGMLVKKEMKPEWLCPDEDQTGEADAPAVRPRA